ncbi:MAG: acetyltransferase [Bacteroidales bacterium]|nr:acetyltransferase [Bacteroidales bacterium]
MKENLIIFGTGKIAEAISFFFNRDSGYEIKAYVVDDNYASKETFLNKPVVPLSDVAEAHPPSSNTAFIAVGYQGMNSLRSSKYEHFKSLGYSFASYKSPYIAVDCEYGENSILMDGVLLQPCTKFGNNVFVWGGTMVGHHANIDDHCWLTGGCQVGGIAKLGKATFVGLGAIIGNEINIGEKCMLGAGCIITKSISDGVVLIESNTDAHRLNSDQFTRMSTCFRT